MCLRTCTRVISDDCTEFNDEKCKPLQGLRGLKNISSQKRKRFFLKHPVFETDLDPGGAVGKIIVHARKEKIWRWLLKCFHYLNAQERQWSNLPAEWKTDPAEF